MVKSRRPEPLNERTWAQASEWLLRFSEEEVDVAAREQFNDWLRKSPENVHAYLQVSAFWREADQLGCQDDGSRDIDVLIARAKRETNIYPLEFGPSSDLDGSAGHLSGVKKVHWAAAASLLFALGLGVSALYTHFHDPVYETGIGEQRILNLPDGSTVTLNADSRLQVHFSDEERGIELSEGQALFKVAKNAARPFVVRSGGTSVRAVGTQFDVNRKATGTVVTVVEGRVAVTSSPLPKSDVLMVAGQQLTVSTKGALSPRSRESGNSAAPQIHPVKLKDATAWTEGRLVFEAASLEEVVQEFNRQNVKPLVLEGGGLTEMRITGTFPANDSNLITQFLQERYGVAVSETDGEIRISRR